MPTTARRRPTPGVSLAASAREPADPALAIPLTIRSQRPRRARTAPAADLYHGMAYMGIPVALALGRRHGGQGRLRRARHLHRRRRTSPGCAGRSARLLGRAERGWARRVDRVITVNQPYADVMAGRFAVPAAARS